MTEEKSKFLFSIIVPVYNTEKYVEKTLKSIYEAMDKDCEVIVVNDGSKDNSEEIIKKFINALPEEYKNNFVYVKKDNKGLADTKNVGIAKARGEFISVVDSDDYIDKNFYKIAREYVKDNDIIIYDLYVVFEKNPLWNYTSRACRDDKENFLDGLINGAMSGSSCNKIIKKELNINARFYDLRGTYATRLTNNGTLMNEVSELMGHSDPSITRKYYISTTEDNKREAINNLDKVNKSDVINNAIKFEV